VTYAHEAVDETLGELERLRKLIAKGTSKQVSSASEIDVIKANVQAWFRSRRDPLIAAVGAQALVDIDAVYTALLTATTRSTLRLRYGGLLKSLKQLFADLQADKVVDLSKLLRPAATSDVPPSFASIAGDAEMQKILANRWSECVSCVAHKLPLSTTVMLGGLLEAVLLARINQLTDKSAVINARSAPKDRKTGVTQNLQDWGLSDYIDVAHELKWISDTYKDVGAILRDYRNYIHPYKEYRHRKTLAPDDGRVMWEIGKTIMRQILIP